MQKNKVKQFETIFKHLKNISVDVNLIFKEDGLYTQGMCPAHTSLFELNIVKDWFKQYEFDKEVVIGVNCEMLFKCVNCLEEGQEIKFRKLQKKLDNLKLTFTGENTVKKEFILPAMSIDTEQMEIPEVDYALDIVMLSEQLESFINELSIFGSVVSVNCLESGIWYGNCRRNG